MRILLKPWEIQMLSKFNKILIACFFIIVQIQFAVCYAGKYTERDDDYDAPKRKTPVYAIDESINLVSTQKIEYGKPRIIVKSVFPTLENKDDERRPERMRGIPLDEMDYMDRFNQLISQTIQQIIADYTGLVIKHQEVQKNLSHSDIKNHLYTDYDTSVVRAKRHRIISLRFTIQGKISGVHHAYRSHQVLNYDLNSGEILDLCDLFKADSDYLYILSRYSYAQLSKRLSNKMMVENGTSPTLDHFKNWNIKGNGLLITFDENQVAPAILGAQTVFIPFSILKNEISYHSPLFDCLRNKRSCLRNNLLTGGFIDEAANMDRSNNKKKHNYSALALI